VKSGQGMVCKHGELARAEVAWEKKAQKIIWFQRRTDSWQNRFFWCGGTSGIGFARGANETSQDLIESWDVR
jgi:hypothetical protein